MRRLLFAVPVVALLLAAGNASAEWLRIKVNIDPALHDMGNGGGGGSGMPGGGMTGGPGMPGMPGNTGGGAGMMGGPGRPGGMMGGPGRPGGMGGMMGGPGMPGGMMGGPGRPGGMGGMMGGPGMPGGMMGRQGGMGMGGMMGRPGGAGGMMGGPGMPGMPGNSGGAAGMMGGPGMPGMPGMPGGQQGEQPKDEGPWLYVYIEVKDLKDNGTSTYINHKWGKSGLLMDIKDFVSKEYIPGKPYAQEFAEGYKKVSRSKAGPDVAKKLWDLANNALAHGLHKQFHQAMDALIKLPADLTKDYQANIKNYQHVRDALKNPPAVDDPAIKAFTDQMIADQYRHFRSERVIDGQKKPGFFVVYTKSPAAAKQKLELLEANLENFYYWFAMQKGAEQPALPRTKLVAVMNDPGTFQNEQVSWGIPSPVADGFTPRSDNVIFLSDERQDPAYTRLIANVKPAIEQMLQDVRNHGVTEEMLLSGKIWEDRQKAYQLSTTKIGEAQTLLIVRKALQEDAERATITHEGTRQLLVASGMFPRHVDVPEWVLAGLASYFETPVQAVYPGVGLPSWTHLVSFKHLQKTEVFAKPSEVLYNTLTDRYFARARHASELAQEHRDDDGLADKARESWDLARTTAWGFVYHLASNDRINELVAYGRELNQLPRDMELGELALQGCAARAFKISDSRNAARIDMPGKASRLASAWFKQMADLTLDKRDVEDFHTTMLSKQFTFKRKSHAGTNAPGGGSMPPGFSGPGGSMPPGFSGPGGSMPPGFSGPGGSGKGPGAGRGAGGGPAPPPPPPGGGQMGFNGGGNVPPPPPPGGFKGPQGQ
jgi:hypothetical protein